MPSMDGKKIAEFFESVHSFLSGDYDKIPWSDEDVIAGCERNFRDAIDGESLTRLSSSLVLSRRSGDVQRGIGMLEVLLAHSSVKDEKLDLLLAVGYYNSEKYSESTHLVERCLQMKPDWKPALVLQQIIKDEKITKEDQYLSDEIPNLSGLFQDCYVDHTIKKKDSLMLHLLRIACYSKGSLSAALSHLTDELRNHRLLSEGVAVFASKETEDFYTTFNKLHQKTIDSTVFPDFWVPPSIENRYSNDFKQLKLLGHGGFGRVMLCQNKLDKQCYAVKKIPLEKPTSKEMIGDDSASGGHDSASASHDSSYAGGDLEYGTKTDSASPSDDSASGGHDSASASHVSASASHDSAYAGGDLIREVLTLATLHHRRIVRYHQAWIEVSDDDVDDDDDPSMGLPKASEITKEKKECLCLFIQMELCTKTLEDALEKYTTLDTKFAWKIITQVAEGLAYIHQKSIIHRDLSRGNIFLDSDDNVKIGDFGLAKFLKREKSDQSGNDADNSGCDGAPFYIAPEIISRVPKIDRKVDVYSLGVLLFELWCPFGSGMERHITLTKLKKENQLPDGWVSKFPEHASVVQRMISTDPSCRPSVTELIQDFFPLLCKSDGVTCDMPLKSEGEES